MIIHLTLEFSRHLDRSFGYPPNDVVEKFQQRLKAIKNIERYSELVQAIHMENEIRAPQDMIRLIQRSVEVSNEQGYTTIRSGADQQDLRYDLQRRNNRQQNQQNYQARYRR